MSAPARRARPLPSTAADWQLEAEREHWSRMLASAVPGSPTFSWALFGLRDVEDELARRRERVYKRAQAPTDVRALVGAVKDRADLLAVFCARLGPGGMAAPPWGSKRQVHIRCPFHADRTPSLVIYADEQRWWCFGACQSGGDAIDAAMALDRLDFYPALLALAHEFGVALPAPTGRGGRAVAGW